MSENEIGGFPPPISCTPLFLSEPVCMNQGGKEACRTVMLSGQGLLDTSDCWIISALVRQDYGVSQKSNTA